MKTILFSVLLFICTKSFASQLVGDFPKVQFGNIFISVEEVCVQGNFVKTINEIAICQKWDQAETATCIDEIIKPLKTTISYLKIFPVGEGNYESVPMTIPMNYTIAYGTRSESGIRPIYYKNFSIPRCE